VADCEGCLEKFFDENPNFYDELRLFMFERDYPETCNYPKIERELIKRGFKPILTGHQNVYERNITSQTKVMNKSKKTRTQKNTKMNVVPKTGQQRPRKNIKPKTRHSTRRTSTKV
jgi:hypothetical protein